MRYINISLSFDAVHFESVSLQPKSHKTLEFQNWRIVLPMNSTWF